MCAAQRAFQQAELFAPCISRYQRPQCAALCHSERAPEGPIRQQNEIVLHHLAPGQIKRRARWNIISRRRKSSDPGPITIIKKTREHQNKVAASLTHSFSLSHAPRRKSEPTARESEKRRQISYRPGLGTLTRPLASANFPPSCALFFRSSPGSISLGKTRRGLQKYTATLSPCKRIISSV